MQNYNSPNESPTSSKQICKMDSDIICCFEKGFRKNYKSARHNLWVSSNR